MESPFFIYSNLIKAIIGLENKLPIELKEQIVSLTNGRLYTY